MVGVRYRRIIHFRHDNGLCGRHIQCDLYAEVRVSVVGRYDGRKDCAMVDTKGHRHAEPVAQLAVPDGRADDPDNHGQPLGHRHHNGNHQRQHCGVNLAQRYDHYRNSAQAGQCDHHGQSGRIGELHCAIAKDMLGVRIYHRNRRKMDYLEKQKLHRSGDRAV